jgi:hypothetical protein
VLYLVYRESGQYSFGHNSKLFDINFRKSNFSKARVQIYIIFYPLVKILKTSNTRVRLAPSVTSKRQKAQISSNAHSEKSSGKETNSGLPLQNDKAYNKYKNIARHYSLLINKQKPFFIMHGAIILCISCLPLPWLP